MIDDPLEHLVQSFSLLPGIGRKTALRLTYFLLQKNRTIGIQLSDNLKTAMEKIQSCQRCRNYTVDDICSICANVKRDPSIICVVENPVDISLIEQASLYQGTYFVLMGHLSPLDGVGPDELEIPKLRDIIKENDIIELILATNATVEGVATSNYICELVKDLSVKISRISHGIPAGGEIEYLDSTTITCAFNERRDMRIE